MPETREHVRPLAPASERPTTSDEEEAAATTVTYTRGRRCLRCCAFCCPAVLLLIVVLVIILMFTVFKPKNPVFRLNGTTVDKLELINGTTRPRPGSNMSLTADVTVKNPNYVSFRYLHTATGLFYRGTEIGAARVPPGVSKARRTMRLNVTVDVILDRLLSQPNLRSDLNSSLMTTVSYSKISGIVKILTVKLHVKVKLNCTVALNITSQAIQRQKCKFKFKL